MMKLTKLYKPLATGVITSLLVAMFIVAPVSAQTTPSTDQAAEQSADMQAMQSPCLTPGQSASQTTSQSPDVASTQETSQTTTSLIGTGTDNAGAPFDCWVALNAHQSHWYKFRYGYNADQDDTPNQATVKLAMDNAGCVGFEVWTQERLTRTQNAGSDDDDKLLGPVGAGTPEYAAIERDSSSNKNQNPSKLIWVGSQEASTTFYVVVKNHRDFACAYKLSISGFSVSFPSNAK